MPKTLLWLCLISGHVVALFIIGLAIGLPLAACFVIFLALCELVAFHPEMVTEPGGRAIAFVRARLAAWQQQRRERQEAAAQQIAQQARAVPDGHAQASNYADQIWHTYTKAVGVTQTNDNGTKRQTIIRRCALLEKLDLDHEEDNPVDPNAVRLLRRNGEQIGYLSSELAADVVDDVHDGCRFACFITALTGGTRDKPTRGVNLVIIGAARGVTDSEVQTYVNAEVDLD